MSFNKTYSEKRDFIRMTISAPINAKLSLNQPLIAEDIIEGECRNLSGGGMMVIIAQHLPLQTQLTGEVSSSHGHNPTLKAKVRVVRSLPLEDGRYEVGLEILEVLSE